MRAAGHSGEEERPCAGSWNPCPGRGGSAPCADKGLAWAEQREISGARGVFVASTLRLILLTPAPSWPWEELGGAARQEGCLGSLQMRALTLALFLSLPPALQGMTNDISPSVSNLAAQTLFLLRGAERRPSFGVRL